MDPREDWRRETLDAMLRVGSWVLPAAVALGIAFRRAPRFDFGGTLLVACAILFVAARWLPSPRGRAWLALVTIAMGAIDSMVMSGFVPGPALAAALAVAFAAIFLGRGATLLVIVLIPIGYLVTGVLVTRGYITLRSDSADPLRLVNWVRSAAVAGLVLYLLGAALDFVIRYVEAGREAAARAADALADAYAQLGRLHRQLESTKDDERRRLSRELHDELGQTLTALKLRLQLLARDPANSTRASMDEAVALVDDLVGRVRNLAVNLRPVLLDELGLEAALRALVDEQAYLSGIAMRLDITGLGARLEPELEMACFRVAQEAITNVVRHAQAKHVSVRLECGAERLTLRVTDDGRGMSPEDRSMRTSSDGLGLVGMRERVRALGGELHLSPAHTPEPGRGTCVEMELPKQPPPPPRQSQPEAV